MRRAHWRLLVLLLLTGMVAAAQPELIVAGQPHGQVDQLTVPGVSYAPAHTLAASLGAQLELLDSSLSLELGGRLLQLRTVSDPAQAPHTSDAVAINGQAAAGYPAVRAAGGILVPVKTVAEAFGGFVTVLSGSRDAVEVRLPRARLTELSGSPQRLSVHVSAPVPFTHYFNERSNTVHVQFRRTEASSLPALQGQGGFSEAWLLAGADGPELRVSLAPGSGYQLAVEPAGSGWRLSLHFTAQQPLLARQPVDSLQEQLVLLDPAAERQLTDLSLAVATRLRELGVGVLLSRDTPDAASPSLLAADRADLYLQLASTSGTTSINWLADAADAQGLQRAAELSAGDRTAVDRLRRRLLLGDFSGRQLAARQAQSLSQSLGVTAGGLPLPSLAVSNGHGLLLNLAAGELADPGLAQRIASSVLRALELR